MSYEERLKNKLALWETPGFSQFVEDLSDIVGPLTDIRKQVEALRKIYVAKLEETKPVSKFKQTKLPL